MDQDKEWEQIMEHTEIASQMHDIENKLIALVEKAVELPLNIFLEESLPPLFGFSGYRRRRATQ